MGTGFAAGARVEKASISSSAKTSACEKRRPGATRYIVRQSVNGRKEAIPPAILQQSVLAGRDKIVRQSACAKREAIPPAILRKPVLARKEAIPPATVEQSALVGRDKISQQTFHPDPDGRNNKNMPLNFRKSRPRRFTRRFIKNQPRRF